MRRDLWHTCVLGVMVALLSIVVPAARGDDAPKPALQFDGPLELVIRADDDAPKTKKHWLGVHCEPVDDALRAQLKLTDGVGLILQKIHPKSPAADAGLETHDVLVAANDKPLRSVDDLVAAIEGAGDKEITFELVRGGERKTVTATPRAEGGKSAGDDEAQPLRLNIVRPGQLLGPGARFEIKWQEQGLPDNMSVSITKKGKDPARIAVERDGKKWDVSEDKLGELPADVREPVERMTRRFMFGAGPQGDVLFMGTQEVPTATGKALKYLQDQAHDAGADVAYRQALAAARNAQRVAQQKVRQLEERYRPSKVLAEDVTPRVEVAVEQAKQLSLEALDARFEQLERQLGELHRAVRAMRSQPRPPAPPIPPVPPTAPVAPVTPAPPATPAEPAPPKSRHTETTTG